MKNLAMALTLGSALFAAQAHAQGTAPSTPGNNPPATMTPSTPATPSSPSSTTMQMADPIYTTPATPAQWRSSEVIGKPVYNTANERIGEIDDLLLGPDGRVAAAVVGVGGFLGMGERKVAISFPAIKMVRDDRGAMRAQVEVSKDMLKNSPEYKSTRAM